jgi:hypothetical protein
LRNLLDISQDTTAFPWAKRTPIRGLQSVIAVALALVVGRLSGHESAGAIAAGSAFTVGFALFHEALASTLVSMVIVTLGLASGTLAGSLGAEVPALVLLLALIAAVNYGLLAELGPTSSWIGQQSADFVVVASYFPRGLHYAVGRAEMVLLGGALQMLSYTAFHLHHRVRGTRPAHTPLAVLLPRARKRTIQILTRIRGDLHWSSPMVSYILRLLLAVGASTAIYQRYHIRNGYWAPMTALLVLRPGGRQTMTRAISRVVGTIGGAGSSSLLLLAVHPGRPGLALLVLVAAFGAYLFQKATYGLFSAWVTAYVVFLYAFARPDSGQGVAEARILATALGGGIALAVQGADWGVRVRRRTFPRPG